MPAYLFDSPDIPFDTPLLTFDGARVTASRRKIKTSRCKCCCPPLFGSRCLLPEFFLFNGSIACVCPEAPSLSGSVQLTCNAYCNLPPGFVPGDSLPPISNCNHGWGYYCDKCADGKIIAGDPQTDGDDSACGNYCCCAWHASGTDPTRGPTGSGIGPCPVDGGTGLNNAPCIGDVSLTCGGLGSRQSSARCKHGPKIIYTDGGGLSHGQCNWLGVIGFSNLWFDPGTNNPESCTGPCWDAGLYTGFLAFRVDCGDSNSTDPQNNILGCNPGEKFTCPGPATIVDPITGLCRRKVALHMTPIGWLANDGSGSVAPLSCTTPNMAGCYLDFSEVAA